MNSFLLTDTIFSGRHNGIKCLQTGNVTLEQQQKKKIQLKFYQRNLGIITVDKQMPNVSSVFSSKV